MRPALIKAGLRAVAERGPEGFTLRDVARRAGVTPSAVYRHFEDKDQLLAAIASECAERIGAAIDAAVAATNDHPLARFRASGIAIVKFAVEHPEHFRALAVPGLFEQLPAERRAKVAAAMNAQRADVMAGQAAGYIADIPIDELLLTANATVHGLAHMIVEGQLGEVSTERAVELATAVTGALGVGFVARADPPDDPMRPELKRRH